MALQTRRPTGQPAWDLMGIAAGEKCGKSFLSAQASASEVVNRTFWFGFGEADPDEYGAIPGARFEIVEYDKSYNGLMAALREAIKEPRGEDGKPNLIILDKAGKVWEHLSDQANAAARRRAKKPEDRVGDVGEKEAVIHPDLWNQATNRWYDMIDLLKEHDGPVILTALLKDVVVMDAAGRPTKERMWKIEAQKNFAADMGCVVEIPRLKEVYVTGVRSLKFEPVKTGEHTKDNQFKDFTVEKLWGLLGLTAESNKKEHATIQRPGADRTQAVAEDVAAALALPLEQQIDALGNAWRKHGTEVLNVTHLPNGNGTAPASEVINAHVARIRAEIARAQQDAQGEAPAQPAQQEQSPRAQEQVVQEQEARAQEPAQGRKPSPIALLGDEIQGHAATLGTSPGEYVKPLLAQHEGAQRIKDIPVPKVLEWVAAQRPAVALRLRQNGEASAAEAVESYPAAAFGSWEQVATPREDASMREPVNA